jgi:hypothetical protein
VSFIVQKHSGFWDVVLLQLELASDREHGFCEVSVKTGFGEDSTSQQY